MKILLVSRRFYPDVIGGGEISAYHIAKSLQELGNEVHVYTFVNTPHFIFEEIDNINVKRFPLFWGDLPLFSHLCNLELGYIQMANYVSEFIGEVNPDVVHLLNIDPIYFTPLIIKKRKIPLFATLNSPLEEHKGNPLKRLYWWFNGREFRFFAKKVDMLFPVSNAIKYMYCSEGFDENKMRVIHNPIPLQDKIETDLKERLSIAEDKKVILYAGRINEGKGVHKIIKAMNEVDAVLLILGKANYKGTTTEYYKRLEDLVWRRDLNEKVKFLGFIHPDKIKEYYSITDLVVLPCTYYEPLSRMLLEACSYGIPLIASNVGGNPEIVEDGKTGILLKTLETKELVDAVRYILENQEVYGEMSRRCREKIRREFSPEKVGEELMEEYQKR